MPIHNWAPVDDGIFHHFHQQWTVAICNALNAGLLPSGYSALVEQRARGLVPDVLTVQRRATPKCSPGPAGGVLTTTPPNTRHVIQTEPTALAARANRVAIRHRLGEIVCVIEVVSPGNKSSRNALRAFVEKSVEFIQNGVHLLVIDLFPPGKRDPQGIHKAIWDEIEEKDFELTPEKPLTLAAYRAGDPIAGIVTTAYVEPVGVGDTLPNMPAYLEPLGYVSVPLESTYQTTWTHCPEDMRVLVETGHLPGESE